MIKAAAGATGAAAVLVLAALLHARRFSNGVVRASSLCACTRGQEASRLPHQPPPARHTPAPPCHSRPMICVRAPRMPGRVPGPLHVSCPRGAIISGSAPSSAAHALLRWQPCNPLCYRQAASTPSDRTSGRRLDLRAHAAPACVRCCRATVCAVMPCLAASLPHTLPCAPPRPRPHAQLHGCT